MEVTAANDPVRPRTGLTGIKAVLATLLYGSLLVASLLTLSDWRIRLATVAVILMFAGRTLWQPRTVVSKPFGREADLAPAGAGESQDGSRSGPM